LIRIKKVILFFFISSIVFSNPKGGKVLEGSVEMNRDQSVFIIQQYSDQAILHWDSFSISERDLTQIIQPSVHASLLNRVEGNLPSKIDGSLIANGKVYLLNPNGILIGPKGKIQTSHFVASCLNISDEEFLNGSTYHFSGDSDAKCVNLGSIQATDSDVVLIGKEVENYGKVTAKNGVVALVGSNDVLLREDEEKRIWIHPTSSGCVQNSGEVQALQAELIAAGGSPYSFAVNHAGVIDARGISEEGGRIYLTSEEKTNVTGEIYSEGRDIHLLGKRVIVDEKAIIDASSSSQGGQILIGGDYQGKNPEIPNAELTYVGPDATIRSDSHYSGDGGRVILWGDYACHYWGDISARGGEKSGDGGFIEVSSHYDLRYKGHVDTTAPMGKSGTLLLDPSNITINGPSAPAFPTTAGPPTDFYVPTGVMNANLAAADVQAALVGGNNVEVRTNGAATTGNGTVTFTAGVTITWGTAQTFTILADREMIINNAVAISSTNAGANFNAVDFQAAGTGAAGFIGMLFNGSASITTVNGNINLAGTGGNTNNDFGIEMLSTSSVTTTGTGANAGSITMTGVGGSGNNNCYGIYLNGVGVNVSTVDGSIQFTGTSNGVAQNNAGIYMQGGAVVECTGTSTTSTLQFDGTGGNGTQACYGIRLNQVSTRVTSNISNMILNGTGGNGSTNRNRGMLMQNAAEVQSIGSGVNAATITMTMMSGTGVNNCQGIRVNQAGTLVTSIDGDINISATGNGTGNNGHGFDIRNNADVTSTGVGANAASISITGTPSGGTSGAGLFFNNGAVTAAGPNAITMMGTGQGVLAGLDMNNAADLIGGGSHSGNLTISVDTAILTAGTISGTGDLLFQPIAPASTIGLGNAAAGTLNLDSTELGFIANGFNSITFGRSNGTGTVEMTAFTYLDPLVVQGGTVTVSGAVGAGANAVTFNIGPSSAGTLNLNALVTTTSTFTVNGGPNNDTFNVNVPGQTGTFDGSTATNTLNGPNDTVNWTITGDDAGTMASTTPAGTVTFSNMQNLVGNAGVDNFTFNGAFQISGATGIDGSTGANTLIGPNVATAWTIDSDDGGTINPTGSSGATNFANIPTLTGGSANDGFTFSGAFQISTTINGGGGAGNSITGPNVNNAWAITGANAGSINPTGATGPTTFTNIQALTGNASNDVFTFSDGAAVTGAVNGVGAANNSFDYSAYTTSVSVNLAAGTATGTGGFSNIQTFTGGTVEDSITGPNVANTWTITADNTGTVGSINFSSFENLIGGTSTDSFTFNGAFQISGTTGIDGNGGTNTATGPNVTNAWTVTGDDAGTINPTGSSGATLLTDIQNFTGGSGIDTFTFNGAFQVTGAIDGNGGTNTVTGPNVTNAWTVTADDTGTINPTGSSGATTLTDIQNFTGGSGIDTFTFNGAFQVSGAIDGNGGANTVTGPDEIINTWAVTADDAGTINPTGSSGATTLTDIQNFIGGTGVDNFTFNGAFQLSGTTGINGAGGANTLTGPNGVTNTWAVTADNGGTINPAGSSGATNFSNVQNLTGGNAIDNFTFNGAFQISGTTGIDGNGGTNSITGPNVNNAWAITSTDAGTVNPTGATNFTDIQNLTGGSANDTFTLSDGVGVTGAIDGTSATGNTLNYTAYTSAITINLQTGTATNITGGISNIQNFIGPVGQANSFTVQDVANAWQITADDTASVTNVNGTFSITNFPSLIGAATNNDTFTFNGAFQMSGATGIDGNGGTNTITGPNVINTWSVTANDVGSINPTGASGATTFTTIQNLIGGTNNDTFNLGDGVGITGTIDGGGGATNTIDYSAYTTPVTVNLATPSATNVGSFTDIQSFVGGTVTDTFIGPNAVNTWNVTANNTGNVASVSFSSFENLTGGTNNDTFIFSDGVGVSGAINGTGISGNTLNYLAYTSAITINLQTGAATNITGGISNIQNFIGPVGQANSFTVQNLVNAWMITADDTASMTNVNGTFSITNFPSLIGGTNTDTFTFNGAFQLSGATGIDGNGGTNTITGPNAITNAWTVTADDAGTINPTGATGATTFTDIQNLTGGNSTDTFTFNGAFQITGTIDGNGGTNTITGPNVNNAWAVTSTDAGTINPIGASGASAFTDIQNLTGGTANDTFTFSDGIGVTGAIDGTGASGNTFDYSAYSTPIAINVQTGTATNVGGGFSNIQNFIAPAGQMNSFTIQNLVNAWTITGDDAATVTNAINTYSLTDFASLVGGTTTDVFTFAGAFQMSGLTGIDGNGGTNTVVGPDGVTNTWTITNNNAGTINPAGSSGATVFGDIQNFTGGNATDTFTFNGAFQIPGTIDGNGGTNTITGPNVNNAWAITSTDAGSITPTGAPGASAFTDIQNLTGGTANDTFILSDGIGVTGAIDGTSATGNTLNYLAYTTAITINLQTGTATNITGGISNIQNFIGPVGQANSFTIQDVANAWMITADDTASVTNVNGTFSVTNFPSLVGAASNNDTFSFNGAFQMTGATGINGNGGTNTITGPNVNNAWAITANNAGSINPTGASGATTFTNIQNLTGGSANDTFTLSDGVGVTGAVNGTSATGNTLNYLAYTTPIAINLQTGTATNITGGISNIQNFIGPVGLNNTFTVHNLVNAWLITANDTASVTNANGTFSIVNFPQLVGGTNTDTFTFLGAFQMSGVTGIDGGIGTNTITGPNVNNGWAITASNAGSINPTGATGATTFTNIQNLTGGTANDTFTLSDGVGVTGAINGTSATGNSLNYLAYTSAITINLQTGTATNITGGISNIQNFIGPVGQANSFTVQDVANAWMITADDTASVTNVNGTFSVTNFPSLVGAATNNDTFTFNGAFQMTGATGIDGNGGANTIVGPSVVNTWSVTANDAGSINPTGASGPTTFTSVQNLTGGMNNDTFNLSDGFGISGMISGNGGTTNTIDYSAYTTAVTVNLATPSATNVGSFSGIQSFVGGSTILDAFVGPNGISNWAITADDTGTVAGVAFSSFENLFGGAGVDTFTFMGAFRISGASGIVGGVDIDIIVGPNVNTAWTVTLNDLGTVFPTGASGATRFSTIPNLTGGTANDTFTISDGVGVSGIINGGGGTNSLDLSAYTTNVSVDITAGTATGSVGIANLQDFTGGSATNTIRGPNTNNLWTLTGLNTGNIDGIFTFSAFQNLEGGGMDDTFDLSAGLFVSSINGISGSNSIRGPNVLNNWMLTADNGGNLGALTFSSIGTLVGGTGTDNFIFSNTITMTGTIDGGAPAAPNTMDYTAYTTPVSIFIVSPTSGGADNLGAVTPNFTQIPIGNIIGNIVIVNPPTPEQIDEIAREEGFFLANLSLTVTEIEHYRLLPHFPNIHYYNFNSLLSLPFAASVPFPWKIIDRKEPYLEEQFQKSLESLRKKRLIDISIQMD